MACVLHITDPFRRQVINERHELPGGRFTVASWLSHSRPGFTDFPVPTVCLHNNRPLMRALWPVTPIEKDDVVTFFAVPGTWELALIITTVVLTVTSVVLSFVVKPPSIREPQAPDPVYELSGQRNQTKLGSPIEVPYGRCRIWPSYAAAAYTVFEGNDQYIFQLYCIGQGRYDIGTLYFEDTPITSFPDVTYAVYGPGEAATLFPNNVVTSAEVSGLEIFAPNESKYVAPDTGFVANPPSSGATELQVDLVLPLGLYYTNDDGSFSNRTVVARAEYRSISQSGVPMGGWILLADFNKTLATNTPQRYTLKATVPSGRYEVRVFRTNNRDLSTRAGDLLRWDTLRAVLPSTQTYGDVTVIAVKARATNSLNNNTANRLNLYATRRLRKWNVALNNWTDYVPTRSIVWAFVDVFCASYGGRMDPSLMDWPSLLELDVLYEGRGETFDAVMDASTTVWEAASTIARCGRAVPMLNGSRVTMVRDSYKTTPTAVFAPHNMVEGSFKREYRLADPNDYDGVQIEYMDAATWKPETVLCVLDDDLGDNPEQIVLLGCTDRDIAYREGLYIRATRKFNRQNTGFSTGLEGHIPLYGDLVLVTHDVLRTGHSGFLVAARSDNTLELSEPVEFSGIGAHSIILRGRDGVPWGPYSVTPGAVPTEVVLASPLPNGAPRDTGGNREPTMYVFGPVDKETQRMTIVGIAPGEEETVDIVAVPWNPTVYGFDGAVAPPIGSAPTPPVIPAAPSVTGLVVRPQHGTDTVLATWSLALGARYYVVQKSADGASWTDLGTTLSPYMTVQYNSVALWVRVAGVNSLQGQWTTWQGIPSAIASKAFSSGFSSGYE